MFLLFFLCLHLLSSLQHQKSCAAVSEAPADNAETNVKQKNTFCKITKCNQEGTMYEKIMIYHSSRIFSDLSERPLSTEVGAGDLLLKEEIIICLLFRDYCL